MYKMIREYTLRLSFWDFLWKSESLLLVIKQGNHQKNVRFQNIDALKNAHPLIIIIIM